MDFSRAIELAQLVNAAYSIAPNDLTNSAGTVFNSSGSSYVVVTTIYAFDLKTDMNPARGNIQVSIGLILQAVGSGDVVIAIRGTEGILEWIADAEFLLKNCPFLAGAGQTEDGFTDMYSSLCTGSAANSPSVVNSLSTLPFPQPASSLTICGHSLGGALATLLALDVAANTTFKTPTVFTYASPRTGDPTFAGKYNQVVPNTFRIVNRTDLVPRLPFPPLYEHVDAVFELNPVQFVPFPPRLLVKLTVPCAHALNTYLFLLTIAAGGAVLPLDQACAP